MKKCLLVLLCFTLLFTSVACDSSSSNKEDVKQPESTQTQNSTQKPTTPVSPYDDSAEALIESKYENLYTDITEPEVLTQGISWPQGQALPTMAQISGTLDAIDVSSKTVDVKSMAVSLQGIVNKTSPRILVLNSGWKEEGWPDDLELNYELTKDVYAMIEKYKSEISGLVVWDKKERATLNLATTIAGLENCLAVTEKQAAQLTEEPYNLEIKYNFVGQFEEDITVYEYLYENFWSKCTKRLIVGLSPDINGHPASLRDLAIAAGAAVVWLDPNDREEKALMEKFFGDCTPVETYYAGWWTSEGDGIDLASKYGIATVPSDYFENYTVYAGMSRELNIPTVPAKPELENKFYIAFAVSDGDNIQYLEHALRLSDNLWESKKRGDLPIAWTFSPALLDAAPQMLNWYYKNSTENDMLICGPSGLGYTDIQKWTASTAGDEALAQFAKLTDSYFRRTAFNFITIWDYCRDDQAKIFAANLPSLVGFSVQERFSNQAQRSLVNGVTPFFTTHPRYDGDIPRVEQIIKDQINAWSGNKPGFMLPQVIAWEAGVSDIRKIAKNLTKEYGDKVEFVRVDHLMMLYSESRNAPYNITLQNQNITASSETEGYEASKIADGSFSKENGWVASGEGQQWLMVDLGTEYEISRYTIENAGTAYYGAEYNTRHFKIEASTDGENWTTIDEVNKNRSNIVDKYVDTFTARYVRVSILNPGEDGIARVQEFTLHGVKA